MLHLQMNVLATGSRRKMQPIRVMDPHTKCDWNPLHEGESLPFENKQTGIPAAAISYSDACPK